MATLTVASGVYVGTRQAGPLTSSWFAGSPTAQFTQFTLTSTGVGVKLRQGPQAVVGHANLYDEPVVFEFNRLTRDKLSSDLASVAVKNMLNGAPRTTLSGFRDVVAGAGRLAKFSWTERKNAGGAGTSFDVWGVCKVVQPSVRGLSETMQLLVYPCDLLWWTGTDSVFIRPGVPGAPG